MTRLWFIASSWLREVQGWSSSKENINWKKKLKTKSLKAFKE